MPMDVNELSSGIQDAYRIPLAGLHAALLGPEVLTNAFAEGEPGWRFSLMGPLQSLENEFAEVTISSDRADLSWLLNNDNLPGQCVTLSVAGHHTVLRTRITLTDTEYVAWAQAVLGVAWFPFIYRAGATTDSAGRPVTSYFRLFLDANGHPCLRPPEYQDAELELIETRGRGNERGG